MPRYGASAALALGHGLDLLAVSTAACYEHTFEMLAVTPKLPDGDLKFSGCS